MNLWRRYWRHSIVVAYLIIFTLLLATKLINEPTPFYDWDESIYAQVGREMVKNRSIVPLWQGQIWLDKPPLVPLFYGVVLWLTPFVALEIAMRLATLALALIVLAMIYALYYKVTKDIFIATLTVIVTSTAPIFLQRSQVGNIDVFLLLGWLGYVLFYKRRVLAFIFLTIAVMSKSLVGFYPIALMTGYYGFLFFKKKIKKKELLQELKIMAIQSGILFLWYLIMLAIYGRAFFIQHIIESHTKRVTASIESHFGKRTFYIDLLLEQFGQYVWLAILGFGLMFWQWYKNSVKNREFLFAAFLLPWFFFLNLTKTKIFWYGYPYIPQIVFLMFYPLLVIKKYLARPLYIAICVVLGLLILKNAFIDKRVHLANYSRLEDYHQIAKYAHGRCDKLYVLVDLQTREASKTLERMNLLITTSRWWGNHPSMVYYFSGPIEFVYSLERWNVVMNYAERTSCLVVNEDDKLLIPIEDTQTTIIKYGSFYLFRFIKDYV